MWTRQADDERRFWDRVRKTAGCWLWTGYARADGYGAFRRKGFAHGFALEEALGRPLLPGMCALHTCDVRLCVRNDTEGFYEINGILRPRRGHLWEGTSAENTADKVAKGRCPSGARNGAVLHPESLSRGTNRYNAKFTEEQIRAIRRAADEGARAADLAREYGVGNSTILHVIHRESWKHV